MVGIQVTEKVAEIVLKLQDKNRFFEIMAFVANVQEAAIEARSCLTKEQSWDLFSAIQDYKCLLDELSNYKEHEVPCGLCLYKEEEIGEL